MATFHGNINIQTLIGLFFLAFCLAMALFGFLLVRFRFLDGKQFDFSGPLGMIILVASAVLAFAAILLLVYVRATL